MFAAMCIGIGLFLYASPLSAQWYNPDRAWESWQRRHPWLQQLDNTDAKSWGIHAAVAVGAGSLLGLVPGVSRKTGMQAMCAFYVGREFYGVAFEGNRKWLDATMDVVAPCVAVALVNRVWR